MSAQVRSETNAQVWPEWQGAVINGVYPLRRILHASDHSAVFLTEGKLHNRPDAAIKIVRVERVAGDLQLRRWRTAGALSHPHLIRLLDSGPCQLGGHPCLFVVMEYAEQTLAQVLAHRALTADEVRDMLPPALGALGFLHRKNLVHGQLRPANFLVVGDQLKLASDAVRPSGEPRAAATAPSLYDPPEATDGRLVAAGDIWGLGVTLAEALTQALPWPDAQSHSVSLPGTLPPALRVLVERCLSHSPAGRPTASELLVQLRPERPVSGVPAPQPVARTARAVAAPPKQAPVQRRWIAVSAAALLVLTGGWAGWRALHSHPNPPQSIEAAGETSPPPIAVAPPAEPSPKPPQPAAPPRAATPARAAAPRPVSARPKPSAESSGPVTPPSVVHMQLPSVAHSALMTIHGHVKVGVLVIVDRSGAVIDALVEEPGPSSYFARLAREAARGWRFAPADTLDSRQWLLRFEFSRGGVTGQAAPRS